MSETASVDDGSRIERYAEAAKSNVTAWVASAALLAIAAGLYVSGGKSFPVFAIGSIVVIVLAYSANATRSQAQVRRALNNT